jgi:hypothetical protein
MRLAKALALLAGVALAAQAGAAVRPAVASGLTAAPMAVGARMGAPTRAASQKLASGGLIVAVLAAGVVAGGIVLATDNNHHDHSVSP